MRVKNLLIIIGVSAVFGLPIGVRVAQKYSRIRHAHGQTYFGPFGATPFDPGWNNQNKTAWSTISGKLFNYTLVYPANLNLIQFPDDPNDSVGINGPEKLILFVETPDTEAETFVRQYYRRYSGLSGLKSIKATNTNQNLSGWEASYSYKGSQGASLDIFLKIPKDDKRLIHLMRGDLDEKTFRDIVDKFKI